jgi:IS30 family transposase
LKREFWRLIATGMQSDAASREGDLIVGMGGASAIGTVVERTTRFTMLVHLPGSHDAVTVRDALATNILTLPSH